MTSRLLAVSVSSVQYLGEGVGREISLEVGFAGEYFTTNLRLAAGQSRDLNFEIAQLWTEGSEYAAAGQIGITERDAVYSEMGFSEISWDIDLRSSAQLEAVQRVEVVEAGGRGQGAVGVFLVTLRARAVVATRFVQEPETGWLTVLDEGGTRIALPETLCVELFRVGNGREHFTITEGPHRGKRASVRLNSDGSSVLSESDPRGSAVRATYSVSRKTLTVGTLSVQTVDYPLRPWTLGTYDVEIPDSPHKGGLRYPEASRSRTWFRVGHTGDRYLHTGAASAGCITVVDRSKWDRICASLLRGRKGDRLSVGTVEVKA